ncbi:MFS transporter [Devosia sp. CN2-171]|uniref:MFS transporter n=1 Tax=Devosia sp. CN2-171 TaxID=3400909 RepID=UPI003BF8C0C8
MPGGQGYRQLLGMPMPRRLALAALPADFADWLDYAAVVALLVFAWGEGPLTLALFAVALSSPYVIIGPALAVLVDRLPLGRVMLWSNLGRAAATFLLIIAPNSAVVLALVFVRAAIDSAFGPARQSAIKATTPVELLGVANGMHQAINQISKIVGPALGGALLAFMPAQSVFAVNGGLSIVAAALVIGIRLPRAEREVEDRKGGFLGEAMAGFAEFGRSRLLLVALVFSSVAYFSMFLYDALIALLMTELGLDATAFGLSISASGLGGLIGALLAGRVAGWNPLLWMGAAALFGGLVTIAVAVAALAGLSIDIALFCAAMLLMGGSSAFMLVPYRTAIQSQTHPDRLARVVAAGEAVTTVVMLTAPFIGSVVATRWGTPTAFIVGGIGLAVLGLVTVVVRLIRRN